MELSLKGKKILITGAGAGIGLACAEAFVTAGADVAICDVEQARLDGLELGHYVVQARAGRALRLAVRTRQTDGGVELVRVAERLKHLVVLASALAVEERRRAGITGARVDLEASREGCRTARSRPDRRHAGAQRWRG